MLILITKQIYKAVDTLRPLYDHSCLLFPNTAQLINIGAIVLRGLVHVSMHIIFFYKALTCYTVYLFLAGPDNVRSSFIAL